MNIVSLAFPSLVILSVIIYYLLPGKYRVWLLAILSCAFIASLNYLLLPYVLVFTLINYYLGIKMSNSANKLIIYRTGLVFNVLQLIILNYATFTIDPVFQLFGSDFLVSRISEYIVPLGISYYTLQGIGYLINIKMGWEKQPETNFSHFLLYISFFPKFMSGPVERSNHFLPQLKEDRSFDTGNIIIGLRIALFGYLKKVAIANQMAPFVIHNFSDLNAADGSSLLLLIFILPMYLYFDFSGYTDMAIGFARMFGIKLLPNFDRPFFAENVTTFWKKFHISLASWFGDYIFRQTVFKRRKWGIYASMYAVFITWILFGIWHGAGWNYMLLGLLQALAINYEFFTRKWRYKTMNKLPVPIRKWFGRIVTYVFYGISLVFFFSSSLETTFQYFGKVFSGGGISLRNILTHIPLSAIILLAFVMVLELFAEDHRKIYDRVEQFWSGDGLWNKTFRWATYSFILSILFVTGNEIQQFIYVQF
jgi:D-alanyl-lipoteichoic acid acyltransferase DltB (MBOAT superfamily)